jgi:hypothetical protein
LTGHGSTAARRSLKATVERLLRERNIPYVDVGEARRALSAVGSATSLCTFHFVVYRADGPNWLVFAAQLRKQARADMQQWEKIFGTGFVAVAARQMRDSTLRFRTLAGDALKLG